MDKKYTSLENAIRNVVRGTSTAGENKSLEHKIRNVVQEDLNEAFGRKRLNQELAKKGYNPDLDFLEKKHKESLQAHQDALAHAAQAQKDYEDLVKKYGGQVEEDFQFDEALGTGGNEKGEFKGTPPAFFKSVHIEPKVGDAHLPASGAAAASRNRAKIASSETMNKEGYIITPTGRKTFGEGRISPQTAEKVIEFGAELLPRAKGLINKVPSVIDDLERGISKKINLPAVIEPTTPKNLPAVIEPKATPKNLPAVIEPKATPKNLPATAAILPAAAIAASVGPTPILEPLKSPETSTKEPPPEEPPPEKPPSGKIRELPELPGGGIAFPGPIPLSGGGTVGGIQLSKHRHWAQARKVYGSEIHNEYTPIGNYIGEDADSERSAIENVARPNSKNKLTKQTEIQRKILENTARRKEVILRAKEENKNGKDGVNGMVDIKPKLKQPDVNEDWENTLRGTGKVARKAFGPLATTALTAYDAKNAYDAGEDPERIALRSGLGLAGGSAGGLGGGALGSLVAPGPGTFVGGVAGSAGGSELGDRLGSYLYDSGLYSKGKNIAKGAVDTVSNAANRVKNALSSPTLASGGGTMSQPKSSTSPPAVSLAGGGGIINGNPLAPSVIPKPTPKPGSVAGAAAGDAIAKANPKPALKLPGPGTPGYRTDAQRNDYEAKRAELLNKYPGSAGALSAGNRSVEAATKNLATNTPVVAPQPSPEINRTSTETPRTMGSSWNNSYKNKYSMGPGPSQFPSK